MNAQQWRIRALVATAAVSAVCAVGLALPSAGLANTTLDTVSSWDGVSAISDFGDPDTQSYGQTITVPASDPTLTGFTFEVELPTALVFRGEVYAWNGTDPTGAALYESGPVHTTSGTAFQAISFNTGSLRLKPGGQYVMFITVGRDGATDSGTKNAGVVGVTPETAYPGGSFFYLNAAGNPYDPSQWTTNPWSNDNLDLAFRATFTPATAGKVLVLGTSTSTTPSVEEAQARAQDFDVDVVNGATWDAMTPSQFAAYRALIIGDHACGNATAFAPAESNAATWAAAVTGPVLVTGADAEDHSLYNVDPVPPRTFMRQGIAFAAQDPARTGAYVGIGCAYGSNGDRAHVLDGFGTFTVTHQSYDAIHADPAVFGPPGLSDALLSNWGESTHHWFNAYPAGFGVWAVALDSSGTVRTSDGQRGFPVDLTRPGFPRTATTAASDVTTTGATLHGVVDPGGGPTTYTFQYGTTTAYGSSTSAAAAGSDTAQHAVAQAIGGLAPATTYHFRVVATNPAGTAEGADQTFTTGVVAPSTGSLTLGTPHLSPNGLGVSFSAACTIAACEVVATETTLEKLRGSRVLAVSARHRARIRHRRVTVGSLSFSLAPGAHRTATVTLNRKGRSLLKRFGKLPVRLKIVLIGPGGQKTTLRTTRLTLKPHHRKHRRRRHH